MKRVLAVTLCMLVLGLIAVGALGREIPAPTGEVVLRITGTIALTNEDRAFALDMEMLRALPYLAYEVEDPWMGLQAYGGVELRTLLELVGIPADARTVVMIAADKKEFPVAVKNALHYPILIVFTLDGDALPGSLGGPLKLAFPYHSHPEIMEIYDPMSWAWFVVEIRVEF